MKPLRITSIRSNFSQELGTKRNTYRKLISIGKTYAAYILKIFKGFKREHVKDQQSQMPDFFSLSNASR